MKPFLTIGSLLLAAGLVAGFVSSSGTARAELPEGPITCAIQTFNGHYLTAVGGGGRTTNVIHTDAVLPRAWEYFTLEDQEGNSVWNYAFKTADGRYLTAVGGGGRIFDVIHSDAPLPRAFETFTVEDIGNDWYGIKTANGHYLTAVGGGGHGTDVQETIHSDAVLIRDWEKFRFDCPSARQSPGGTRKGLGPGQVGTLQNLNPASALTPTPKPTPKPKKSR
jgi:hypothetical protein